MDNHMIKKPDHDTKTAIILFLMTGKKSRNDILSYIKNAKKLKENRGIDKHLNDLKKNKIINVEGEKGFKTFYQLNDTYDAFKQIITLVDNQDKLLELMRSSYFQDKVENKIFNDLFIEQMLPEIKTITKTIKEFFDHIMMSFVTHEFKENDINEDHKLIEEMQKINVLEELSYTKEDKNMVINILKTSPSALKLLINFSYDIMFEPKLPDIDNPKKTNNKIENIEYKINDAIQNIITEIKIDQKRITLDIFNSLLISDIFVTKQYVKTPFLREFLSRYIDKTDKNIEIKNNEE